MNMPVFEKKANVKDMALGGLCAAVYVALTGFFAPISFGNVQVRVSEALYAYALISPMGTAGVTVGCLISNLLFSPYGIVDVLLGTLGTFIGAMGVYLLRRKPMAAYMVPVVSNGIFVALALNICADIPFLITALYVAAGEAIAIYGIGPTLYKLLRRAYDMVHGSH